MAFNVKKRGKLTYYYQGDHPVLSPLVTEDVTRRGFENLFFGTNGRIFSKRSPEP